MAASIKRSASMLMLAMSSTIVGALLGHFFKVLVLPVAILLGVALIIIMGMLDREAASSIAGASILLVVCIQLGYLVGASLQFGSFTSRHIRCTKGRPGSSLQ